jgi:hypothetical protein
MRVDHRPHPSRGRPEQLGARHRPARPARLLGPPAGSQASVGPVQGRHQRRGGMAGGVLMFGFDAPGSPVVVPPSAVISADQLYRYWLTRQWSDAPPLVWVMLNPSTSVGPSGGPRAAGAPSCARGAGTSSRSGPPRSTPSSERRRFRPCASVSPRKASRSTR